MLEGKLTGHGTTLILSDPDRATDLIPPELLVHTDEDAALSSGARRHTNNCAFWNRVPQPGRTGSPLPWIWNAAASPAIARPTSLRGPTLIWCPRFRIAFFRARQVPLGNCGRTLPPPAPSRFRADCLAANPCGNLPAASRPRARSASGLSARRASGTPRRPPLCRAAGKGLA